MSVTLSEILVASNPKLKNIFEDADVAGIQRYFVPVSCYLVELLTSHHLKFVFFECL